MHKKTFFFLSIFLLISVFQEVTAQSIKRTLGRYNEYGFRLGINYSDIDFDDNSIIPLSDGQPRYGLMAGFFCVFHFTNTLSIQPEIQYSSQGEKFSAAEDSSGIPGELDEDELKINLIQIPVFLNYTIANKFVISAGPQLGLNIWEWERDNDYQPVQFSAVGGVAYKITDNFSLALRASLGITDAIDADNSNSFEVNNEILQEPLFVANGKNHYLQLSIGYQL